MQNRRALRALGIFFLTMAFLTLIARAADTLTLANVRVEKPEGGTLMHETRVEGTVEAVRETFVWTVPNLRVASVLVAEGARVEPGDALARLEETSVQAALDRAQAEIEKLEAACVPSAELTDAAAMLAKKRAVDDAQKALDEAKHSKEKKMAKRTLIRAKEDYEVMMSESAYKAEQEKTAISVAQASLLEKRAEAKALRALLADGCAIRSTSAGLVLSLGIEAGKPTGDTAVARLGDLSGGLRLVCKVTEEQAKFIAVGDSADVQKPGGKGVDRAAVESVSPSDKDGLVRVALSLPDTRCALGAKVDVTFRKKSERFSQCVKRAALRADSLGDFVLVLRTRQGVLGEGSVAERVAILVREQDETRAGIESSLLSSDLVIVESDKPLNSGDRVRQLAS